MKHLFILILFFLMISCTKREKDNVIPECKVETETNFCYECNVGFWIEVNNSSKIYEILSFDEISSFVLYPLEDYIVMVEYRVVKEGNTIFLYSDDYPRFKFHNGKVYVEDYYQRDTFVELTVKP